MEDKKKVKLEDYVIKDNSETKMPSEEEFEKACEVYRNYQFYIQDIAYYKDVPIEKARAIANRVAYYKRNGLEWDWTEPDINYEPGSDYFYTKYSPVYRLSNRLSDKKLVEEAREGILTFKIDEVKKNHPLTWKLYMIINDVVRETYYTYLKNISRSKLEVDRKELINIYNKLTNASTFYLNQENESIDSLEPTSYSECYRKYDNTIGIHIDEDNFCLFGYSPVCFDVHYLVGRRAYSVYGNKELFDEFVKNTTEHISEIEDMSIEEYRRYKIELMKLTDEEIKKYGNLWKKTKVYIR